MKVLGIIPSRLESKRIHQKPLYRVLDIPLIQHVYNRAKLCSRLDDLVVATDATEIYDLIVNLGGKAIMTSKFHKNGTERMAEVIEAYDDFDYCTLINGDEILLNPDSISVSIETLINNPHADASILAVNFSKEKSYSDFKLVFNKRMELMYISRNDIPSGIRSPVSSRLKAYHLMTFKPEVIRAYAKMKKTPLEEAEDHEHLRLLEEGYKIVGSIVDDKCISLDILDDLQIIESYLKSDPVYQQYSGK